MLLIEHRHEFTGLRRVTVLCDVLTTSNQHRYQDNNIFLRINA